MNVRLESAQPPSGPPAKLIDILRCHLQEALEIEHLTIPPYLCALYSIHDDENVEAARLIHSVVMEEMLHMVLVSNVLNAVGGRPDLKHHAFVPTYPTFVRHTCTAFKVHLLPLSPAALEIFLKIERPQYVDRGPGEGECRTIGEFYRKIKDELRALCESVDPFAGGDRGRRQITSEYYYGGGGEPVRVEDLDSALKAIDMIIEQGEGLDSSIFVAKEAGSPPPCADFGCPPDLAHYFRFNEILRCRHYNVTDEPWQGPSGARLHVKWSAVYPMKPDPRTEDYPPASELRSLSNEFNRYYMELLLQIHLAFNGHQDRLLSAVNLMYDLKYKAVALMRVPVGGGANAGPSFQYVPTRGL